MSGTFGNGYQLSSLVDQCIACKHISQQEYQYLAQILLADGSIDEQELPEINRLFDAIKAGQIRVLH